MMKKMVIFLVILLLSIGIVSAAKLSDVKTVNGFTTKSDNFATNGDFGLSVGKYDKSSDYNILFKNESGYSVKVSDISNYTDKISNNVGCMEIVEINGEPTLIEIYCNGSDINKCNDYMLEFNKINNLKPINPIN